MKTSINALLALAALALVLLVSANVAHAACQTDADCPDDQVCLATPCAPCDPSLPPDECPVCENVCSDWGGSSPSGCQSDADCAAGEVCELVTLPCAPLPRCACPDCPEGAECPPCDCPGDGGEYPCDDEAVGVCMERWQPEICGTDADCPVGFSCTGVHVPCPATPCACACAACEEGAECPPCECPPCEFEPCEAESYMVCQYDPPTCEADADCPEGFECVADEICMGSGCACPACMPGEECPPCDCDEQAFEETCEVVGQFCAPADVPCAGDVDCAEGWVCQDSQTDCLCPACACPPPPECAEGAECPDAPPCDCGPCDCGGDDGEGACVPEGWDHAYGPETPRPADGGASSDPNGGGSQATGEGSDGTAGGGGGGAPPASDPSPDPSGSAGASGDPSASTEPTGLGCAATPGAPAPFAGLLLLALLGGALVFRARARG